jgi:hypothetical protein
MSESTDTLMARNRAILCHFDSYSTALLFARWGQTMLWPQPLPASSSPMAAPATVAPVYKGEPVRQHVAATLGLNEKELIHMDEYQQWIQAEDGPIRIQLLRFTTFEAPKAQIDALGAVFKPISELRGGAMSELVLLREVFNLIVAGGGRA